MPRTSRGVRIGHGRVTNLRRRSPSREPRRVILIDTNGKSTEQDYFNELKCRPWVTNVRVVVVFKNGAPIDVVRDAGKRAADGGYDEVWAVCDVDEFSTEDACTEATRRGVKIAWSNPCFELWILLHLADHQAYLPNGDKARERLAKCLGKAFDKTALNIGDFEAGISDAIKRAQLLGSPPADNPSTNVWEVVVSMGYAS